MSRVLPILFNTNMVQAIMDDRKTATRRIAKGIAPYSEYGDFAAMINGKWTGPISMENVIKLKAPYHPGDILYVRETFFKFKDNFYYKADGKHEKLEKLGLKFKWRPSIHMPCEAARIWLKVTDVRVERLHDITEEQAVKEGLYKGWHQTKTSSWASTAKQAFMWVWDMTIKRSQISLYGWIANPWVWVIEFERCEKPEPCIIAGVEPAQDKRPCIGYGKSEDDDEPCEMCKQCNQCTGNDEFERCEKPKEL